ncbi:low-specificity L-threonine aldolase [Oceanobacillus oncorhynchi subsp. oncorhynchi]|uniref:low-specificity L-threonine aldolase n=1 Tax=Oceanobacillus oncorhynchi TaxID=545501 RepID=UPI0031D88C53
MSIDFRSDTVSKPTKQMRKAIFHAAVGDDVYGEDPTINQLERLAAEHLGKDAGLFVTSGTQGNLVAVLSHTRPGAEVILAEDAHLFYSETGSLASIAGVQTRTLKSTNGQMDIIDITKAIRTREDMHQPQTELICLENTHARSGGRILPLNYMKDVYNISRNVNVPIHLDGSRIFNASIGLGVSAKELAQYADTVQICLSKGLGAPMGSVLVGSKETITKARKWRKSLGGGTRQAGIVGAAGIIALEEMIDRLAIDHKNAKVLAENIKNITGLEISTAKIESNIVLLSVEKLEVGANEFTRLLKERGVLASVYDTFTIRFVTHHEISEDDVKQTIETIIDIVNQVNN